MAPEQWGLDFAWRMARRCSGGSQRISSSILYSFWMRSRASEATGIERRCREGAFRRQRKAMMFIVSPLDVSPPLRV